MAPRWCTWPGTRSGSSRERREGPGAGGARRLGRPRRRGPRAGRRRRGCPTTSFLTAPTARLVGAQPDEVVVMNTLTVNLHLMMVSFYRPTAGRYRILYEGSAFPSDQYAFASQVRFHGFDPAEALVPLSPRPGEDLLRPEDMLEAIARAGRAARPGAARQRELPHRAGLRRGGHHPRRARAWGPRWASTSRTAPATSRFQLHDDGPDFAVWCSYKYLNGGPGALGGALRARAPREAPRASALRGLVGPRQGDPLRDGAALRGHARAPRGGSSPIRPSSSWRRCGRRWSSSTRWG